MLTLVFNIQPSEANPTIIRVPQDYPTIQEGINHAIDGDTILVDEGIYPESIEVNKSVTIEGTGRQNTIVDGIGAPCAINVTSDYVNIRHLTVQNATPTSRDEDTIKVGITWWDYGGMVWERSNFVALENVEVVGGIFLITANSLLVNVDFTDKVRVTLSDNVRIERVDAGNMFFEGTRNISIARCSASDVDFYMWDFGGGWWRLCRNISISLSDFSSVEVHDIVWEFSFTENNIEYLWIHEPHSATPLEDNLIGTASLGGPLPYFLRNNTISSCIFKGGEDHIVVENRFDYFEIDWGGSPATLYHNNFFGQVQVNLSPQRVWDDGYPSGGNYWSDYTGVDLYSGPYQNITGSDGIGDEPYILNEFDQDNYPLMKPYGGLHDIGITNIATSKTVVGQGYSLNITIKIINYGITTETFSLTVYANKTEIDTLADITLASRNSTTITFTWNTTDFAEGNYAISACATYVPGEIDIADNAYVDGEVTVLTLGFGKRGGGDTPLFEMI